MKIKFIGILVISLSCFTALAQMYESEIDTSEVESFIFQPERVEFEFKLSDRDFYVISAEDEGLLIARHTSIRSKGGRVWYLYMYDTALVQTWKKPVVVPFGSEFMGYDYNKSDFFFLFNNNRFKAQEMLVAQISKDGEDQTIHEIDTTLPLDLTHFETLGDGLIFGGESSSRPVVLFFDLKSRRPRVLPGIYNAKSRIIDIETSDEFKMFSVLVSERTQNKDFSVTLKVFSDDGELLYTSTLETEREKNLMDAVSTNFKNGVQYISGTYGNNKTDRSKGFYLARVQNGQQLFIKYHPYTDLYNFFSYMKEKRKKRIKKRIERKKIKGKQTKLNYRLLVHDIVRNGDEYIVIGEAYYPKYRHGGAYATPIAYDPFTYTQANQEQPNKFIGYQYTHAVVASFNEDGELLWDDSFEINDVILKSLDENVQVNIQKDRVVLLYAYENLIRSKVIQRGGQMISGNSYDPIELTYKSDKIKKSSEGVERLEDWYSNTYFAYGTHRLKNTAEKDVKLNRKVFYVNKVSFDLPN